jgi:hypothetical protein
MKNKGCPCKDCLIIPACRNRMTLDEEVGPQVIHLSRSCPLLKSYLEDSFISGYDVNKKQARIDLARKIFKLKVLKRIKY